MRTMLGNGKTEFGVSFMVFKGNYQVFSNESEKRSVSEMEICERPVQRWQI
jgi:hypothetical protein